MLLILHKHIEIYISQAFYKIKKKNKNKFNYTY